jgi:hypothetical protein
VKNLTPIKEITTFPTCWMMLVVDKHEL